VVRGGVLGLMLFVGFVFQTVGMKYTSASKSAFVTGLMVVFTPMLQLWIERKPPKTGNVIGVVLVAIGLYFLTSPKGSEFNIGDGLSLLCAIIFSFYTVYLDVFGKEHEPAHLTFVQFAVTAILASATFSLFETPHLVFTGSFICILGYLIMMPTIVALYVMAKYQRYTTPTRSAVIYSMEPPFAVLFAFLLAGDRLGLGGIGGGALILCGVVVSQLSDVLFVRNCTTGN
jgi:drug/metabolite transporter (DMT)-like permease